jgi:hypothetical protein
MLFDPYAADLARSANQSPLPGTSLAADVLLAVPLAARGVLWAGLTEAVGEALTFWERTPAGGAAEPPSFPIQHAGKRSFNPADLHQQTLANWHRLTGLELRLAVQALEALLQADTPLARAMLAEQCARVGQLYSELERRAGADIARCILRWELRLLRYRSSPVLASLIYG